MSDQTDSSIRPAVLKKLQQFDVGTICNVIELFDVIPREAGWVYPPVHALLPKLPAVAGFAVTATFRGLHHPHDKEPSASLPKQIEAFNSVPKPWIVVIQDLDDPPKAAVFGEVMVSTYKGFGAVGLVTNGHGRDMDAIEQMGFGCWAAGASPSHGWSRILEVMLPVRISGLQVQPGDLLFCARDGATRIPLEIAEPLADACDQFVADEEAIIAEAKSGRADTKAYDKAFQQFVKRRKDLTERLRSTAKDSKRNS